MRLERPNGSGSPSDLPIGKMQPAKRSQLSQLLYRIGLDVLESHPLIMRSSTGQRFGRLDVAHRKVDAVPELLDTPGGGIAFGLEFKFAFLNAFRYRQWIPDDMQKSGMGKQRQPAIGKKRRARFFPAPGRAVADPVSVSPTG